MTVLAVPLSAQGTKLSEFTLGAGVAVPFGKLADIAGPGPTFSATVTFPIGPLPTAIRLHAAYSVFGFADRSAPVAPTTISGGRQNPAYVELTAGIQFESLSERPIMPFAHVAWGFFFGEGSVPSNVTGGDHNTMHPGGSVGGGIKFRAASRLLSIDARYATMAGGDKYLPVTLGITF
jgi:hypothetical protein